MKMPSRGRRSHACSNTSCCRACRRSSRCRRRRRCMANSVNRPPTMKKYQLSRLNRGKGQVLRADHQRNEEIAQRGGDRGDEEEEDHHRCRAW